MGIGEKIKEYRMSCNMTQKDLADRLHVTNQAVSRWENNEAEPSFETLRLMASIFQCTINDLFDMQTPQAEPIHEVTVVERIVPQESKPVLTLCENCNRPIYDQRDKHRFIVWIRNGRASSVKSCLNCTECYNARVAKEKKRVYEEKLEEINKDKARRIRSFVISSIVFAILLFFSILSFSGGASDSGIVYLVLAVMGFCFSSCLCLNNNFIEDRWVDIASWGFVRLPGVIMEFSIGGLIIGFLIKIALWILGLILAVITTMLATVIGLFVSVFVYPYALVKNIKATKPIEKPDEAKGE